MKVLLTGITGNLGFEIACSLRKRGVEVLPVVRTASSLEKLDLSVKNAIEADLTDDSVRIDTEKVDCIVHCAGNVNFIELGDSNCKMMQSVIEVAKLLGAPIYYISTAFLWRESGNKEGTRNAYESDKLKSEKILSNSSVPHTIFRPSVLVGNSLSGKLINWTGYYILAAKFLEAAKYSNLSKVRFPSLTGTSNIVPVDQAAEVICETVADNKLNKMVYVTNPEPPRAQWVLDTTLEFFGIEDRFDFETIDFADYEQLEKTKGEEMLYLAGKHFGSYWSLEYNFPKSAVSESLITEGYLKKTLRSFQDSNNISVV